MHIHTELNAQKASLKAMRFQTAKVFFGSQIPPGSSRPARSNRLLCLSLDHPKIPKDFQGKCVPPIASSDELSDNHHSLGTFCSNRLGTNVHLEFLSFVFNATSMQPLGQLLTPMSFLNNLCPILNSIFAARNYCNCNYQMHAQVFDFQWRSKGALVNDLHHLWCSESR